MDCRDVRNQADAVLDGEAGAVVARDVLDHLESCAACREELEARRALRATVKGAFERAESLRIRAEFAERLAVELRARSIPQKPPSLARWLPIALLTAAASCFLAVGLTNLEHPESDLAELARQAVADHRRCVLTVHPRHRPLALDEAGRLFGPMYAALDNVTPQPPDPGGEVPAVLERHACLFEGRRFAHIVVRYHDRPASVLVPDAPNDRASASIFLLVEGFSVVTFPASEYPVFVVSSLDQADSLRLARAFRQSMSGALDGL